MPSLTALGWFFSPLRRKWTAAVLVALLIGTLFLSVQWYRHAAQEARVEADVANAGVDTLEAARASDDASAASVQASRTAITQTESEARVKTEEALAANPDWAGQPVPADVLGSLRR